MMVDVAPRRLSDAMRRVGRMLLEDFGARPAAPADAMDEPAPAAATVAAPAEVLVPAGVVWCGRAPRRPQLERFVDHLTAVRAQAR
jgi:hypothetical protein